MNKVKARKVRITARIGTDLLAKVRAKTAQKKWTLNTFIEESLINAVEEV